MVAEQKTYLTTSMEYVLCLQRIQEKKKFQFVETLLTLIKGWKTFYHEAYDLTEDYGVGGSGKRGSFCCVRATLWITILVFLSRFWPKNELFWTTVRLAARYRYLQ